MRPSTTPRPLAVAVGLAAVAADKARELPGRIVGLPDAAVRLAWSTATAGYARYQQLAERGQDVLSGSPRAARDITARAAAAADLAAEDVQSLADRLDPDMPDADIPDTGADSARPEHPAGTVPPPGAAEPVFLPPDVQRDVAARTPGALLDHDDLPLADFDHLTVPQLRGRIRRLDIGDLVQLRDYERAHADRLPVITVLENRIAALVDADGGAGQ
jgi:hypothetical protein